MFAAMLINFLNFINNNNFSISRLLDWFPCLYRRTEQGSRTQQTSLRLRYGIARLTIYTSLT